jgi:hypothetical protein
MKILLQQIFMLELTFFKYQEKDQKLGLKNDIMAPM